MKNLLNNLFNLPRTFLAWILFHLASWMDMKVIPNKDNVIENILDEIKDVDIEED